MINGGGRTDAGIVHGARLISFTEAVMRGDAPAMQRQRETLRALLSPEAFVDTAAIIAAFNVVDRIADATGIPLDAPMASMSADVRQQLNLARFGSSANSPSAP